MVPGDLDPASGTTVDPSTGGGPGGTTWVDPTDPQPTTTASPSPTDTGELTDGGSAGEGSGDASTGPSFPALCGPPCAETWTHDGNLTVGAETHDFTCLTRVTGDLWIGEKANLATIASLGNLREVSGAFTIAGVGGLVDLDDFGCLREVESLALQQLPALVDVGGLAGVRIAPRITFEGLGVTTLPEFADSYQGVDTLVLRDNPALLHLDPAGLWGTTGAPLTIQIGNNPALLSIAGLGGILLANGAASAHVELDDLPALTSLTGLEPLVAADLHVTALPLVTDLMPLSALKQGGQVTFDAMPKVLDLAGLAALNSVHTLTLGDCSNGENGGMDGLTSLAGLASLTSVDHLRLAGNDGLVALTGAPELHAVSGVAVVGSPALPDAAFELFLDQLDDPPWHCYGDWERCQCSIIQPG